MFLKLDTIDEQIVEMARIRFAIYRVTVRVLWGSTWDELTGTKRQLRKVLNPELRIERFLKSPTNIGASMLTNCNRQIQLLLLEDTQVMLIIKQKCI